MTANKIKLSRRNFLLVVGAGGAASAASLVATSTPQRATIGDDKKKTKGYQASEHIRNYYRTAKV